MMMSFTNDVTTAANVTPMMNATASCSRLPLVDERLEVLQHTRLPLSLLDSHLASARLLPSLVSPSPARASPYPQAPVSAPDASCQ